MEPDYLWVTSDNLLLEEVSDYRQFSNDDVNDKRTFVKTHGGISKKMLIVELNGSFRKQSSGG